MITSVEQAYRANRSAGMHWGSPETLRFFAARVESPLIAGRYWVESTKNSEGLGREYRLAVFDPTDSDITYVLDEDGCIGCFDNRSDALVWLAAQRARLEKDR